MKKPLEQHNARLYFPGTLMGALGAFAACAIYMAVTLGSYTPEDAQAYERLISGADDAAAITGTLTTSRQQRSGSQKDLLFAEKQGTLAVRLLSARSELAFDRRDGGIAVVERMEDVTCFMQEELLALLPDGRKAVRQGDGRFLIENVPSELAEAWLPADAPHIRPMQVVRRLDAKTASYYYKDGSFVAEDVSVQRYLAAGHELDGAADPIQPLMEGVAQAVDVSLKGSDRNFRAHHLKATFFAAEKS